MPTATAPTGSALPPDPSAWIGRTFLLTVPEDNWVSPRGVGAEIGPYVPTFMMTVSGAAEAMTLTMGTANAAGAQDLCVPTTTATAAATAAPVQIVFPKFPLYIQIPDENLAKHTTIQNLTLTDVLPQAGSGMAGSMLATMDLAEMYPLFHQVDPESGEDLCGKLPQLASDVECTACPDDGAMVCLPLEAIYITATEAPAGVSVTPVAAADMVACPDKTVQAM